MVKVTQETSYIECLMLQEKEVKLKEKMNNLRHGFEENVVGGFMSLFGRDGRIVSKSPVPCLPCVHASVYHNIERVFPW